MKPIFSTLVGLMLLVSGFSVKAQNVLDLSFSPAMPGGTVGSTISVDVIANTFDGIAGAQFPILYDATKLQFVSCTDLTQDLPGFIYNVPPNASSIANPAAGKVSVVWFDGSGAGNYLGPNTVLFRINFMVLAAGTSNIYVANAPPPVINVFGEGNTPATFTHPTGAPVINGFALVMGQDSIMPGDTVCMPVSVNDFTNIVGMQFMVNWNSNVFTFSHVQNITLPYLDCTKFNPNTPGRLAVNWEDITGIGTTIANGSEIFDVCLIANGPQATNGNNTTIACNGAGMPPSSPIAIENAQGNNVWSATTSSVPGGILVSNTAAPDDDMPKFCADTLTVSSVGQNAVVGITVKNFNNLNSFQWVLMFDPAVLGTGLPSWTTILPNGTLPGNAGGGSQLKVELIPGQPGKLKVTWRAISVSGGQTFPDGTPIITFTFPTATATPGAMTTLMIGGNTTAVPAIPMQVTERNFTCAYMPKSCNGFVKISASTPNPLVSLASQNNINCFGNTNGSINITVSGGTTSNYTYNWSGPGINAANQNVQNPTNLTAGTYQVTVTAGSMTTSLATPVTITAPSAPISIPTSGAGALAIQQVKCFGAANGSISFTPQGGTAPFTYSWSNGTTSNNNANLVAGAYTVTITDSKSCTFAATYTLTQPAAPPAVSVASMSNVKCLNETNGNVSLNLANLANPVTYTWTANGLPANPSANNFAAGTYMVTATDVNGCTAVLPNPVTVNAPAQALMVPPPTTTNPTCPGTNNGTISVAPSSGWTTPNYTYAWTGGLPPIPNPTGVAAGTYTVTVTDGGGCALVRSATLTSQSTAPSITNLTKTDVSCFNQGDGCITLTLSGAVNSINWNQVGGGPVGSGTNICGLGGGTYVPTVSYGTGCTSQLTTVEIINPNPITLTFTMTQQNGGNNGAVDLSVNANAGTGLLTYSWVGPNSFTANTQDVSGLAAGTYTCTVKDANNCQSVVVVEVTSACIVCATTFAVSNACENDGCITATIPDNASGPFILTWANLANGNSGSTPSSSFDISECSLPAGTYMVTVTDATNQSTSTTVSIGQNPPASPVGSTVINPTLANSNGSIILNPGPGLAPSYEWISGQPNLIQGSPVQFNLDSGTYCVKVTNLLPNGCEKIYCFTIIREYPALVACAGTTVANSNCLSENTGSITVNPQGGDNTFTYSWSNGATTKTINSLGAGTYTCTITTGDGQSQVCSSTITTLSNLAVTNVNEVSDYNGFQVAGATLCNGVANVVISGANGTASFLWSNGVTTASNTTLCGGPYSVIVTDQTGCTSSWSGELTSPNAVNPNYVPGVEYNGYGVSCNGSCDAVARISVNGGVAPYTIKWPGGKTEVLSNSQSFAVQAEICAGEQNVIITDGNGVVTNYTINITEPDPITITFTDIEPTTLATCDGEIIPLAEGAVGDVTYTWVSQFHQGEGLRADGLCADEEVLFTLTDENGCTANAKYTVPFPIEECFKVNPVVTPNGDGDNDYFYISCLPSVPNTIEIYNRYNQAVTNKITNYQNNWDAKRGGIALPEGVYFYVATFTNDLGNIITLKGYFNVLH